MLLKCEEKRILKLPHRSCFGSLRKRRASTGSKTEIWLPQRPYKKKGAISAMFLNLESLLNEAILLLLSEFSISGILGTYFQ